MLLEEALSSGTSSSSNSTSSGNKSTSPPLPPSDAALALLSFLRDELPAGGISAEKRFINLFSLIVDRAFGELNRPQPPSATAKSSSSPGTVTSPGGSTYSSPASSPSSNKLASTYTTSTTTSSSGQDKLYQHADGGWLSLLNTPKPTGSSSSTTSSLHHAQKTQSLDNDPIVKLLRAPKQSNNNNNDSYSQQQQPTLLNALSAESIHRPQIKFKFPLGGLSPFFKELIQDWKMCYLQEVEIQNSAASMAARAGAGGRGGAFGASSTAATTTTKTIEGMVGKENATKILYHLLLNVPNEQVELKTYFQSGGGGSGNNVLQQKNMNQLSSPRAAFITPMKQQQQQMNTPRTTTTTNVNNEPNLELTMLEYYLLIFLRFPLANQEWEVQLQDQLRRMRYGAATTAYGQRVYSHLMSSYMKYYLPHGVYHRPDGGVGVGTTQRFEGGAPLDRTAELFLRLVIEFWVEGQVSPPTFAEGIQRYRNGRSAFLSTSSSSASSSSSSSLNPTLRDSLELTQPLKTTYVSPPSQIQIGVLNLVRHLVSDVTVRNMVKTASMSCQRRQTQEREGRVPTTTDDDDATTAKISWCLQPAMTTIQPSIFNYIRLGLTSGSIHDRRSIFHRALEAWLVWVEPWNYVMKRRAVVVTGNNNNGSSSSATHRAGEFLRNAAATVSSHRVEYYPAYVKPKPTSPSTYSSQWEAYVVANLNLYTVPLAIFLKRARELDFSSTNEYPRSLALVQRVLRVFSKQVVTVLNSVLNRRADALSASLATMHRDNLKAFCPPSSWTLADCQLDATNLLEEVFSQYQKRKNEMDIFDRIDARLNALFSGKIGSDETALQSLLSQVRYLMHLPQDYQVLPEEPKSSRGWGSFLGLGSRKDGSSLVENLLVPERDASGRLTDKGRAQIYSGMRKCNPIDVHFVGDPLLARVKTYEIPVLVELTVQASNYLNQKLGLVSEADVAEGQTADEDTLSKHYHEMERYQKTLFRINLRFLADSRNIIFAYVLWWLFRTIGGFFSS
ncbi:putative sphingomyelin phosphodiesterase [Skeletonema marinoi]|uniref:Sphingomyelin phosphodiesterase n=1 Tax=Skeletonema marinoi TaxID=267567 RepID=A0AAD8Y943_9STRA|nr:putative sphingomyelin phosphodiesterase [Skeletonema marinoi]